MNWSKLTLITLLAIIMLSLKQDNEQEATEKANEYMNYLNNNRIRGGCFYVKGDSIVTFKNYKDK